MAHHVTDAIGGELRLLYQAQLKQRELILEPIRGRLKRGAARLMDYEELEIEAHKLVGTGTTYGYEQISKTAAPLEQSLRNSERDQSVLEKLLNGLLLEIRSVLNDGAHAPGAAPAADAVHHAPSFFGARYMPLVLVVDDDPEIQRLVAHLLKDVALVQPATTGAAALAAAKMRRYDLILLDNQLPDLSGRDILANLARHAGDLPTHVVMMTAFGDRELVGQLLRAGAKDYIVKPFGPADFVRRVQTAIATRPRIALIADDDPLVRQVLRSRFEPEGITVLLATNGADALAMARRFRPEVIVLDRRMPRLDGLSVMTDLRADPISRSTPTIILSAVGSEEDVREGYECGATDYFVKPFRPAEIVGRCLEFLAAA